MSVEIGAFALSLALALSLLQGALGLLAGANGQARLGRGAAYAAFALLLVLVLSFAALMQAFLVSDFSVALVADHSHVAKPLLYKIAGVWGNHEGSMLLWCLVGAIFGACLAAFPGGMSASLWARTLGVHGLVGAGTLAYTLFESNPFARLDPAPFSGSGLNPLLQDPALALHPPFLYLGYVGFSLVFSLAIAALIEGRVDQAWARWLRPWAIASWALLTIGIGLGAYWAYYELGWGGWWFWDPVENASFMPWLVGAALMHSAIITQARGAMARWTILLAIATFGLSLVGTFLVRSGVLTSVHAFAVDPERGLAILALLASYMGVALVLFGLRARSLAGGDGVFSPISREGALVLNNLFFAVATATVLIGTLYPMVVQAVGAPPLSVGPPYFNLTFAPLMSALLLALPIAPLLRWRKGDLAAALRVLWPAALLALAGAASVAALQGVNLIGVLGAGLGAWLIGGAIVHHWERSGSKAMQALFASAALWGLTIAHLGVGVFVIGASVETQFRQETTVALGIGEQARFAGHTVLLEGYDEVEGPNYYAQRARLKVTNEAGDIRQLAPEKRSYPTSPMGTNEVAISSGASGDFYVALGNPIDDGAKARWALRLYWNPLIHLVFGGVLLMALGGLLALLARILRAERPKDVRARKGPAPGPSGAANESAPQTGQAGA